MPEKVDLQDTPVLDAHCFTFDDSPLSREDLTQKFWLAGVELRAAQGGAFGRRDVGRYCGPALSTSAGTPSNFLKFSLKRSPRPDLPRWVPRRSRPQSASCTLTRQGRQPRVAGAERSDAP